MMLPQILSGRGLSSARKERADGNHGRNSETKNDSTVLTSSIQYPTSSANDFNTSIYNSSKGSVSWRETSQRETSYRSNYFREASVNDSTNQDGGTEHYERTRSDGSRGRSCETSSCIVDDETQPLRQCMRDDRDYSARESGDTVNMSPRSGLLASFRLPSLRMIGGGGSNNSGRFRSRTSSGADQKSSTSNVSRQNDSHKSSSQSPQEREKVTCEDDVGVCSRRTAGGMSLTASTKESACHTGRHGAPSTIMGEEEIMDIEGVNAQLASDALAEAAGLEVEIVDDNHFLCKDGETLETLMELSDFEFSEKEQDEMRSVKKIYFYSKPRPAKATSVGKKGSEDPNIFQAADHINYRYEIMTQLGSGAFGTVFCCLDHKYNSAVAIKVLSSKRSVPGDHEVKALEMLTQLKESGHDKKYKLRCLPMLDSFLFQGHACLVFPVGGQNLFQFLSERRFKGLSMEFIRRIAKQLLEFLYHLRMLGIVHCDLKPENILIQNPLSGQIAVIDFGCAHFLDSPSSEKVIYIQSRMFRAPEVMMRLDYGSEIDLWSMGAILIEARGGKVAFPGADCLDMMQRFAEVLGPPPEYLIQQCKRIDSDLADFYFENMHVKGMAVDLMPVKEEKPPSIRRGSLGAYESADDMGASNSNTALTSTKDLSNVSLDSNGAMPSSLHQTSGNGDVGGGAENSINCVGASRIPSQMHIRRDSGSRHLRIPGGKKIGNLFNAKSKDESFLSFVEMLLRWDPAMRPAPESALEHPWINAAPGPSEI